MGNDPQQTDRPAWLPDKFKTEADLVKSYHEAEKKISELTRTRSQGPAGRDAVSNQVVASAKDTQTNAPSAEEIAQEEQTAPDDGLELPELEIDDTKVPTTDPDKDRSEVAEAVRRATAGQLDQATIDRLERAGIPRDTLAALQQRMDEGQRAIQRLQQEEVCKTVGGIPEWQKAEEWAVRNLPPDEVAALNEQLASSNMAVVRKTVEHLHWQYTKSLGPKLVDGMPPSDRSIGFASQAEQVAAMKDPRYKTSPAYRAEVQRKSMAM